MIEIGKQFKKVLSRSHLQFISEKKIPTKLDLSPPYP